MRHILVALWMILALLASETGAPVSADTQATATPTPSPIPTLSLTDCNTAQLSDIAAIYLAPPSPGATATPIPIPPGARSYLAYVLHARLDRCNELLGGNRVAKGQTARTGACGHARLKRCNEQLVEKAQAARTGACGAESENDVHQLWTYLKFCEALVGTNKAAPPGIAWQLTSTSGVGNRPVIFVIGLGGDPPMAAKLISTLAVYLNDGKGETGYHFDGDAVLIPEPGMTTDQYATQCESSPNVKGAIVVQITATGKGASDEFVRRRNWTAIEATALYAKCENKTPAYVWVSDLAHVENHHITLTPLTPLAMLLMLGSAYEVFAPSRTTSTATQLTLPNPSPIPPEGRITQISTTNSKTINASGLGGVATSLLNVTNGYAPLAPETAVDQLTWSTLQSLAIELIKDMNCWQPAPSSTLANAQDVIGAPRTLPGYNPPAGLSAYTKGSPSAPFCREPADSETLDLLLPGTPPPSPSPMPTQR